MNPCSLTPNQEGFLFRRLLPAAERRCMDAAMLLFDDAFSDAEKYTGTSYCLNKIRALILHKHDFQYFPEG